MAEATARAVRPITMPTTDLMSASALQRTEPARRARFHAAVWRWHFYTGLVCIPFILWLSVSGSLYLFHTELEWLFYPRLMTTEQTSATALPPAALIAAAEGHVSGKALFYRPSEQPRRSAEIVVRPSDGELTTVFVNPTSGQVLGTWRGQRLGDFLRGLHSLTVLGAGANAALEAVPGLALIMLATGLYLWWPRGRSVRETLKLTAPRATRRWWREFHVIVGVFVAGFLLFFALTALPWTPFIGAKLSNYARSAGLGAPIYVWDAVPQSEIPLAAPQALPWTLEGQPQPLSHRRPAAQPIAIDRVISWATSARIPPGYTVRLPEAVDDVFTVTSFPKDRTLQRVVHLDQYSGAPLVNISFEDYGAIAKTVEWGVGVHSGEQYGEINRWLMFAACLGLIALSISGVLLWWKRRPTGGLAPIPRSSGKSFAQIAAVLLPVAVALPITGAALALIAFGDFILVRTLRFRADTR